MKKAIDWIKSHLVTVLLTVIGVLGAGILWRYHKRRVDELTDRADVLEATKNIKSLNDQRKLLEKNAEKNAKKIEEIDKQLVGNKRRVVEAHEYVEPLDDKQVLEEFARLGY